MLELQLALLEELLLEPAEDRQTTRKGAVLGRKTV
eukprot:SAG22_NODE_15374_length_350_cov_0.820717_2_plen_34_part_01